MVGTTVTLQTKSPSQRATVAEYLNIERTTNEKHYYLNGFIRKMAGASINHNRICRNIITALDICLPHEMEVLGSDQKIYIPAYNFYVYPDAVVVAEAPQISDKDAQAITNPLLIVEVLSPSTQNQDKDEKFMWYRSLPSFREYALVRQDTAEVSTFFRKDDDLWQSDAVSGLENEVFLKSVGVSLSLSRIYKNIF